MKYNDNGTYKDIYVKTFDTTPIGAEFDYDGERVPSGYVQVENYSTTNEIDTGKVWIDNKKIYRKVFTGNIPTTGDVGVNLELTFDQLVSENMYIKLDSGLFLKQGFHNSSGVNMISYGINGTNMNVNIFFSVVNSAVANKPYVLILEYTKTTD